MIMKPLRSFLGRFGAHEALLRASERLLPPDSPRVVQLELHGIKVLVMANEDVGRRMLVFRRYEERDVRALFRLIKSDAVCFDVGANTGYFTMLMAKAAKSGQVHAFEPIPRYMHLLSTGVCLNDFSNVVVNECVLGAESGTAELSEAVDGAYSSLRPVGRSPERRKRSVPMKSLDTYVVERSLTRVDVVKIDVEGAEGLVLEGGKELLANPAARPSAIMVELVDDNLRPYGESAQSIIDRLSRMGYRPCVAVDDAGTLKPFVIDDLGRHENIFFVIQS